VLAMSGRPADDTCVHLTAVHAHAEARPVVVPRRDLAGRRL
jgi:hypothetical protein